MTPEKKRPKIFLEILEKNPDTCMDIIYSGVKIPLYLMTKDEFSKIIKFFNNANKNLVRFDYIEQIERLLNEVNNQMYVNKKI